MNDIDWQDPIRRKLSRGRESMTGQAVSNPGQSSFASRFLGGARSGQMHRSQGHQSEGTFSQQYLSAAATREPMEGHFGGQAHTGSGYQPNGSMPPYPQQHAFTSQQYHQGNGFAVPGHPPGAGQFPPGATQWAGSSGAAPAQPVYHQADPGSRPPVQWNFLDLKNKKQTGDLHKKLLAYSKKNNSQVFCFTSSREGEGVTTVVSNLADYIRTNAGEKRVLVMDANLRSPELQRVFGVPHQSFGLREVITGQARLRDSLVPVSANLWFLGTGNVRNYKDGSLGIDTFASLLGECKQMFDYILIDCPPVLSSSDSMTIAPAGDVTFVTLQSVKVHKQVALKSISLLQENECEIGGIILNKVQQVIPGWVYKFL